MCTLFYFVDLRTRFGMRDHIGTKIKLSKQLVVIRIRYNNLLN